MTEWLPARYPFEWIMSKRRRSSATETDIVGVQDALDRIVARERILGIFPDARPVYETRCLTHIRRAEEATLREKIAASIPMSVFAPCPMGRAAAFHLLMRFAGISAEQSLYIKEQPEAKTFEFSWSECGIPEEELLRWAANQLIIEEVWRRQVQRIEKGRRKRKAAQEALRDAMDITEIGAENPAK